MVDIIGTSLVKSGISDSVGGESTPIQIKAQLGLSNTMLYLALGWLS